MLIDSRRAVCDGAFNLIHGVANSVTRCGRRLLANSRLVFFVTLTVIAYAPFSLADSEDDLKAVQKRISSLEKDINRSYARRDKLQSRLAETERLTAKLLTNIERLTKERNASEARLLELEQQRTTQLVELKSKKTDLAAQVYAAYVGGRQEKIKLLLSQRDPAELGRAAVYYRYLNEHRLRQIEDINAILFELEQLTAQTTLQNKTIKQLQAQRHVELQSLKAARVERKKALAALAKKIASGADKVAALKSEESKLLDLIKELEQIMQDFPVGSRSSFVKLKGQLAWPVKGQLLADFGQSRGGSQIRWDGVLIGAERGAAVRVVARGRVAYADWLPGQGLLAVIEHGDNFFSLYGRADTLTAKPGDWVEAGETIATVGDSGGHAQVALYFALRQSGKPVNPRKWTKGSVSR